MNVGRNDPCPCGSGKKYKKCCGVKAFQHGPEPEERLRRRLIRDLLAFASSREFTIEHQRALLRYWPGSAGLSPNQALARMKPEWVQASFWEWYVHDFRLRDGRTFIDHFVIRRASMLTARERAFLEGARRTFRSLYQVLEVRPEEGLTLRDLFLGGTVDVRERVATRTLVRWDVLAARLQESEKGLVITGTAIPFRVQDREALTSGLKRADARHGQHHPDGSREEFLKENGEWFAHRVEEVLRTPPPRLVTPEGDPVLFSQSHYAVVDRSAVQQALRAAPELQEEDNDAFIWHVAASGGRLRTMATIEWSGTGLVVWCLSRQRLTRARVLLERYAGSWLKHHADTFEDPWEAASRHGAVHDDGALTREVEEQAYQTHMAEHYATWPDHPLPYLNGLTPREAVRTPRGRQRVADLIWMFENGEERRRREKGFGYDVTWLWKELGLNPLGRPGRPRRSAP